jgi:glutamine synthetase
MPAHHDEDADFVGRVAELRAGGVELVAGSVTDLAGVTRAEYVPLRRLAAFQQAGMGVSPSWSVFCVDIGIAFTPSIGVVGDLRIRIDPADLRPVDHGVAWAPGDLPAGQCAVAGVLDGLPDLLGVYAGSVLSASRLRPGNWAGAANCWGLENREAAVRFIAATPGNPHGANAELRIINPSANPYLSVTAFLGSALRGIDQDLELPAEVADNPAQATAPPPPPAAGRVDDTEGARYAGR